MIIHSSSQFKAVTSNRDITPINEFVTSVTHCMTLVLLQLESCKKEKSRREEKSHIQIVTEGSPFPCLKEKYKKSKGLYRKQKKHKEE